MDNEIEETLLKWRLHRVGHYALITVDTDLINEGLLDSLMVMDLVTSIEKENGFAAFRNRDYSNVQDGIVWRIPREFTSRKRPG
jgi:acyl carrier protein